MKFKKSFWILGVLYLLCVLVNSISAQPTILFSELTRTSTPVSISNIIGSGTNIGAWATLVNHSDITQRIVCDRGIGVAVNSGGQAYGKPSLINNQDYQFMQNFYPWYIKASYEYQIQPNATVIIPLYVLCQNLYFEPLVQNTVYSDFFFFTLSDSVMQVYLGVDRVNSYLMDSLRTRIWVQGANYVYYEGTLNDCDHLLFQTGHWVADPEDYIVVQGEYYYALDSLYLSPGLVNWAIWAITDKADSAVMRTKINEWRSYAGLSPLPTAEIELAYCPVCTILAAAGFKEEANKFSQAWCTQVLPVDGTPASIPASVELKQNYPNPFNEDTAIEYYLPKAGLVTVSVFNVLGDQIELLVREREETGAHRVLWNAGKYPSGFYFYRLICDREVRVQKCLHLK